MHKRIWIPVIIATVTAAGLGGWRAYVQSKRVAEVTPVSALSSGYYDDSSLSGMVYDAQNQSVTLDGSQIVSQVYVSEGQQVKAGDPLLAYDLSSLQLSVEVKKLQLQRAQNTLQQAQNKLNALQNTKPVEKQPESISEPTEAPAPSADPSLPDRDDNGLYPYVYDLSQAMDGGAGTAENPYRFAMNADGYVYGNVLLEARQQCSDSQPSVILSFESYDGSLDDSALISKWQVKITANNFSDAAKDTVFNLSGKEIEEPQETAVPEETAEPVQEEGYTAEELAKAIRDAQSSVRNADLDVRRKRLDLNDAESALGDGTVCASKDGVVTRVSDPSNPPQDGSAFLVVSANGGTTVRGQISELQLNQLKSGDSVNVTSWMDGSTYTAVVQSVDSVPVNQGNYYGGNPNVSYYDFEAVISDQNTLSNGDGVEITLNQNTDEDAIWLEQAYVRKEGTQYYVMKDDHGRLARQNVTAGRILYGSMVEITDGITSDDSIAFPYGKNAVEGVRTESGGMQ